MERFLWRHRGAQKGNNAPDRPRFQINDGPLSRIEAPLFLFKHRNHLHSTESIRLQKSLRLLENGAPAAIQAPIKSLRDFMKGGFAAIMQGKRSDGQNTAEIGASFLPM
jgi:hypothetical protein